MTLTVAALVDYIDAAPAMPTMPTPGSLQSGDLVFVHGKGLVARAIRICQWLRRDWHGTERAGAHWNHVAILDKCFRTDFGDYWTVIQAAGKGVTDTGWLHELGPYEIVPLPFCDAETVLRFARAQMGVPYGFLTIASILLTLFTPRFVEFRRGNTWICSALVGEAMRFGGWLRDWQSIYEVSPAQLYIAVTQ